MHPAQPCPFTAFGSAQIDMDIRTIYGQTSSHLRFISPKGTLNPIDIEIRTIYGQRSGPLVFMSQIRTLNRIDIEKGVFNSGTEY